MVRYTYAGTARTVMRGDAILVIDDEPQIRRVVTNAVKELTATVLEAATGNVGIDLAASRQPDLVVLDLGLPDLSGEQVCREIRKWSTMPILVLSARHSDREKADLLDAGADDYVTKPFSTIELQARVRALLRRARQTTNDAAGGVVEINGLVIDPVKPSVKKDGVVIHLTKTEWELLRTLLRHAGKTLTHRQIFSAVWGNAYGDAQQYLRVHIRSLRRKIERDPVRPALILTEPGVGYRFEWERPDR